MDVAKQLKGPLYIAAFVVFCIAAFWATPRVSLGWVGAALLTAAEGL